MDRASKEFWQSAVRTGATVQFDFINYVTGLEGRIEKLEDTIAALSAALEYLVAEHGQRQGS
jgi:hypothetical protein